jgi:hypothetical protein
MFKNFIIIFCLFFSSLALAQEENRDYESDVVVRDGKKYAGWTFESLSGIHFFIDDIVSRSIYTLGVYPRYNFHAPKKNYSLSTGFPMGLGFGFASANGLSYYNFLIQTPITVDLNLGTHATKNFTSPFGFYIGGGINNNFTAVGAGLNRARFYTFGPIVHGGFRWMYRGRVNGFNVSYSQPFGEKTETIPGSGIIVQNTNNRRIFSITLIYGF